MGAFTEASKDGGAVSRAFGSRDAQNLQRRFGCYQIAFGLYLGRFCLFHILLGDRLMFVEIFGASIGFLRQNVSVLRFQVVRAQLGVVGAGDVKHSLAALHALAGNDGDAADRPADLRDDRSCLEAVVGDCASEAQRAGKRGRLDRQHLYVRHLVSRDREQSGRVGVVGMILVGGSGLITASQSQRHQQRNEATNESPALDHGSVLVPTASFNCSSDVM